jgi:tetratricopeptide (TPR) repeat protein
MDVNYAFGPTRLLAAVLALTTTGRMAGADDSVIEMNDRTSMVVISSSDDGETIQQPASVAGNELVIQQDESFEPAATAEGDGASAQGSLSVVANSQRQGPVSAIIVDSEVVPAVARPRSSGILASPHRPGVAGILGGQQRGMPRARTATRAAAPKNVQMPSPSYMTDDEQYMPKGAVASPKNAAKTQAGGQSSKQQAATAGVAAPQGGAGGLLVQSYQLSLTASSEVEYSQIVRGCAEAMRQGLDGENRQFALELSAWALNRRGQLRADQGQRDIAIADFRAALEFDSQCWRALHNRGVTLAQSGQFAEAFDDITRVIQLNPKFAKAYSNRATLYVQAGDTEKAIADYQAAIQIDPTLTQALIGHARVCHMTGRLDEALESFDAATNQDDASAETVCSRGDLLVDLGRYSDALKDYARAIELNPKFEHAYRNGAWLLATCPDDSIRDAQGAIKGAQTALECGYGERHAALDTLAAALANAGRFDEAVGTMQQAIEIAPEDAVPAYQARQQLYEMRQPFRTHPVGEEVQEVEFVEG